MNRRLTSSAVVAAVALTGCSIKAEMSVMKQWDRPAERTIVEDTSHNVKQPPRTTIETQEPIKVEPTPTPQPEATPAPAPKAKPMNFEIPDVQPVIVPAHPQKVQTIYLHKHNDKGVCYVRTVTGTFALNMEE